MVTPSSSRKAVVPTRAATPSTGETRRRVWGRAADAAPGYRLEAHRRDVLDSASVGVLDDCAPEGVLTVTLQGSRQAQEAFFAPGAYRTGGCTGARLGRVGLGGAGHTGPTGDHVGHPGLSLSDCAGLVQNNGIHLAKGLNGGAFADQDAVCRAHAGTHHEGGRRSQTEGAGAGDDQNRDRRVERQGAASHCRIDPGQYRRERRRNAAEEGGEEEPDAQGDQRQTNDHGNKDRGDPVGEGLYGDLGSLRLLYQADHLTQEGILSHAGGPDPEGAVLIYGCPDRFGAFALCHRHGLARGEGFIHRALSGQDDPVGGNLLTGANYHDIALLQSMDRDRQLLAVALDPGLLCLQGQEPLDRLGGAAPRLGLDVAPGEVEGHDHAGNAAEIREGGCKPELVQHRDHTGPQGGKGPHGNEDVHVGGEVSRGFDGASKGRPAGSEEDEGAQGDHPDVEDDGAAEGESGDHLRKHPEDNGDRGAPGRPHGATRRDDLALILRHLLVDAGIGASVAVLSGDAVPRGVDGGGKVRVADGAGIKGDEGRFRCQVDLCRLDAVDPVESFLHRGGAPGAVHSFNAQRRLLGGVLPVLLRVTKASRVARLGHRLHHGGGVGVFIIQLDPGGLRCQIDGGGAYAWNALERSFHGAGASRAVHSLYVKHLYLRAHGASPCARSCSFRVRRPNPSRVARAPSARSRTGTRRGAHPCLRNLPITVMSSSILSFFSAGSSP